jgi:hypothetical protein
MVWNLKANIRGIQGVQGVQGLPGVNAVANDTATAGYISTAGTSATKSALSATFARKATRNIAEFGDLGTADDYPTFAAAIAANVPLTIAPGIYTIATGLVLDISKQSISCSDGVAYLQMPAAFAGTAVTLMSTADYNGTIKNWRKALNNITILGNTAAAPCPGTGLLIGGSNVNNAAFSVEGGGVQGFATNLLFGNNAWKVSFVNWQSRWGNITAPTTITNSGENMSFTNCMINDGTSVIDLGVGDWHFLHTSFDNAPLIVRGVAFVTCEQCHLEDPGVGSLTARYGTLIGANASLTYRDCDIVLDNQKNVALFLTDNTVYTTGRGLTFDGCALPNTGLYAPETNDGIRALVAGLGRVTAKNMRAFFGNGQDYIIAKSMAKNRNGDFEENSIAGFSDAGGTGTFAVSSTAKHSGVYSGKFVATLGTNKFIKTDPIRVTPGELFYSSFWQSVIPGTATDSYFQSSLYFYDALGNQVAQLGYASTNASSGGFVYRQSFGSVVPPGAATASFQFGANGGTTAGATAFTAYIDDVVMHTG